MADGETSHIVTIPDQNASGGTETGEWQGRWAGEQEERVSASANEITL